jgi:hypothetical protein
MICTTAGLFPAGTGPVIPPNINSEMLVPPYHFSDDISEKRYALPRGYQFSQHREDTQTFINCDPQIDVNIAM